MTYYYIVDNALLENNLTIFEDENEFQDSLNFNLDEAIENEELTPEEANIIVDDFNEYTEVEQEINGFTYGKTSDKKDLLNTYSLKVEECDTADVKIEDDGYGDWRFVIKCEGNEWEEDGFDSTEEAEDNALAKVNELLEDFPEGYAVDDFDITFENEETGESCIYDPYHSKCKDSQAQEIGEEYRRLSEKYGVDMDELVYGRDGFMNSCYPHNPDYVYFPDFNGDVIFSKKHWNELVDWAKKNKGINLEPKKEGNLDECDNDACFEATSYIGTNYRGIDDTASFTDISKLQEWLWEKLSKGNFVEVEKAPKEFEEWIGKYNPDKINSEEDIADYEYLLTLKETNNKGNFRDNSQNLFKDTDNCDTIEISDEEVNVPFNQNISFDELRDIFYEHNSENGIKSQFEDKAPLYGNVVISQDSFNKPYNEEERTYVFRSDNKAFLSGMIGNSIISDSKDGSDKGVRLDWYIWDGWKIERCYITKEE